MPERSRGGSQVLEAIEIQQHRVNSDAFELFGGRDVGAGIVEHHQIRVARRDGFDVGRNSVANARHGERCGRVVAPGSPADNAITGPDVEEDFRERGKQRNDTMRRHSIVPTCRRVTCNKYEKSCEEPSLHHPSREGLDWWRERRRLLASGYATRLPRFPQWL